SPDVIPQCPQAIAAGSLGLNLRFHNSTQESMTTRPVFLRITSSHQTRSDMDEITLTGYAPGAIGRIVELHGTYYHQYWDLGLYFESHVAMELAEFLSRFDPARDGAWFACAGNQIVGGIFIVGSDPESPRLRWFILNPAYQGRGIGNRLMQAAMDFCKA